jgi:hypothetical protein
MNRTRSSRAAAKSRRRFLKVVAMGSAAALVSATLPRTGDAAGRPAKPAKPKHSPAPRPAAIEAEIAKQKHSTADTLKTIRDYSLPPGSEMAFVFAPARGAKRRIILRTGSAKRGAK